ncbi:MAG: hypothetical protein ACXU8A_00625 [Burkholderiaceae bacterium]
MHPFDKMITTKEESTKAKYLQIYQSMRKRFMHKEKHNEMDPDQVVGHFLIRKYEYSMQTFRLYKNALIYVLESRFPHCQHALDALRAESSADLPKTSEKTSGTKEKFVTPAEWKAIQNVLNERIKKGLKNSQGLFDTLCASLETGLRPNEWSSAVITEHRLSKRKILRVKNSKHTNGRANGPFREMYIDGLPLAELQAIEGAILFCSANTEEQAEKIQLRLKHEFQAARNLALPKRKKGEKAITIYSFRHQFIANAKATFSDPILIAALAGHNSTKTSYQHYGKRKNGTRLVRVMPTQESVDAVTRVTVEFDRGSPTPDSTISP